jgi:hypothetical protein
MIPFLIAFVISAGSMSPSRDGQNNSVSFPPALFHMAACGPASARLAREPLIWTHNVLFITAFALPPPFCDANTDIGNPASCAMPMLPMLWFIFLVFLERGSPGLKYLRHLLPN